MALTQINHLNGVAWFEAPAPPRKHDHFAQTTGWHEDFTVIQRCPCGAIRDGRGPWILLDEPRVAKLVPTNRLYTLLEVVSFVTVVLLFVWGVTAPVFNGRGIVASVAIAAWTFIGLTARDARRN